LMTGNKPRQLEFDVGERLGEPGMPAQPLRRHGEEPCCFSAVAVERAERRAKPSVDGFEKSQGRRGFVLELPHLGGKPPGRAGGEGTGDRYRFAELRDSRT